MTKSSVKTLEAKCSCGSVHFTFDVPTSSLPLPVHVCHCSVCRFTTGAPCVLHTGLPAGLKPNFIAPSKESNLTSYAPGGGSFTSEFSSTCGCHVAGVGLNRDDWTVSTSIFTDGGPENFSLNMNVFSKSAKDGGVAPMLSHAGGRELKTWDPAEDDPRAKIIESNPEHGVDGEERLRAQCHCGGVSFTIGRPKQDALEDTFMSIYVSPVDKQKWKAAFDLCGDCRLAHGTHVVGWAFAPLSHCEPKIKSDLKIGTAKTYSSSAPVLRSFCGTCGATVFYSHEFRIPSERQQVVDIATGILRAPEGVMAENWLTWRSKVAWLKDGKHYDGEFGESLEQGMEKWAIEKYGKELDFRIH